MKADSVFRYGCIVIIFLFVSIYGGHSSKHKASTVWTGNMTRQADNRPKKSGSYLPEDVQLGCTELRAKRYISDGFCTSMKAIKEVVCAGNCLPIRDIPWYAEFIKYWSRDKYRDFQCEEDVVRRKKVRLLCQNGEYRSYKIKVVKSCKCKRMRSIHNKTTRKDRRRRRRKDRRNRNRKRQRPNKKTPAP